MGLYGPGTVEVVLPDVDADEAERIATAVREAGGGASVPLAFGVAGFPEAAVSPEALVDAARTALDRATARRPLQRAAARGGVPAEASGGDGDGGGGGGAGGRGRGGSAPAPTGGAPAPVIAGAGTRAVFDLVARVADAEAAVLITGETGTGKELVASALHAGSRRRAGPYRAVNCGAIAPSLLQDKLFGHEKGAFSGAFGRMPGLFEEASGGTVFLDEVGELSADAQAALLRVLQEGVVQRIGTHEDIAVDVRVVAATNRDLEAMVEAGTFRRDLFHRLRVVPIAVPPLRARRDEIPALARAFLERSPDARRRGVESIAADAMALLVQQPWPGNIRQLRNEIERAVLMAQGATITAADLPESLQTPAGGPSLLLKDRVRQCEIDTILEAVRRANKNLTAAAALLGISDRSLYYKRKEYGIRSKIAEE
jgi:DNA-binding NtrC family response regulator